MTPGAGPEGLFFHFTRRNAGPTPDLRAAQELRLSLIEGPEEKRGARVYIDVLQNARGHHAVPPHVLRAVPAATGSTPLDWRDVTEELEPGTFTLKRAAARFARQKVDPMARFIKAISGRHTAEKRSVR